jgi:hypothetical protein
LWLEAITGVGASASAGDVAVEGTAGNVDNFDGKAATGTVTKLSCRVLLSIAPTRAATPSAALVVVVVELMEVMVGK